MQKKSEKQRLLSRARMRSVENKKNSDSLDLSFVNFSLYQDKEKFVFTGVRGALFPA
jgi:hypothetical protein